DSASSWSRWERVGDGMATVPRVHGRIRQEAVGSREEHGSPAYCLLPISFSAPPSRSNIPAMFAQDPHKVAPAGGRFLEQAIGREVRNFREKLGLTIAELAKSSGISTGMLSKIENGTTSPSLSSLQSLSRALHVPVTALFRSFEETNEATFVKAGQGLTIERRGTRAGHQYQLLGH